MKTIWGLFILFLLLFAAPTLAQEATPVTLRLFMERNFLIILVTSQERLLMSDFAFRIPDDNNTFKTVSLNDDFRALSLTENFAEPGTCFVYRISGETPVLPSECFDTRIFFSRCFASRSFLV